VWPALVNYDLRIFRMRDDDTNSSQAHYYPLPLGEVCPTSTVRCYSCLFCHRDVVLARNKCNQYGNQIPAVWHPNATFREVLTYEKPQSRQRVTLQTYASLNFTC